MSVSGVSTGHHPEPEWAAGKSLAEIGTLLSLAQLHLVSHHGRNPSAGKLTDLMGSLMLAFLSGHPAQPWRAFIVDDLAAAPYIKGCCKWRD